MEIEVLGCSGSICRDHLPMSFLVNRDIAIDVGSLPYALSIADQLRLEGLIISHSHMDHVAGLPFLLDTIMSQSRSTFFSIYLSDTTKEAIMANIFNDRLWPTLDRYPAAIRAKILWHIVQPGKEATIAGVRFRFFGSEHTVPSLGLAISDNHGWIGITGDTKNLVCLVRQLEENGKPKALFVETTFPSRLQDLATASGHLTPGVVIEHLNQCRDLLPDDLFIYHMKAQYSDEIVAEYRQISSIPFRPLERRAYRW